VEDPRCFKTVWSSVRIVKRVEQCVTPHLKVSPSYLIAFSKFGRVWYRTPGHFRESESRLFFTTRDVPLWSLRQQLSAEIRSPVFMEGISRILQKIGISRALCLAMLHSTHVATRSEPYRRWPLPRIVDQSAARQDASSYDRGSSSAVGRAR